MTRKEAISELKYAQAMCEFNPSTGEVGFRNDEDRKQHEAFGMAIKALQQEEHLVELEAKAVAIIKSERRGEWIFKETDDYKRTYCSVCGAAAPFVCVSDDYYGRRFHGEVRKTKFCPNCGADMRGENK